MGVAALICLQEVAFSLKLESVRRPGAGHGCDNMPDACNRLPKRGAGTLRPCSMCFTDERQEEQSHVMQNITVNVMQALSNLLHFISQRPSPRTCMLPAPLFSFLPAFETNKKDPAMPPAASYTRHKLQTLQTAKINVPLLCTAGSPHKAAQHKSSAMFCKLRN